jgi:hypothetical protein
MSLERLWGACHAGSVLGGQQMKMYEKLKLVAVLVLLSIATTSCQSTNKKSTIGNDSKKANLKEFAYANCFFWYFNKKGYDTKDIRSISGGIVELGSGSADKYQEISLFVKDYKPDIRTKNDIDIDLLKCFSLNDSAELNQLIDSLE